MYRHFVGMVVDANLKKEHFIIVMTYSNLTAVKKKKSYTPNVSVLIQQKRIQIPVQLFLVGLLL